MVRSMVGVEETPCRALPVNDDNDDARPDPARRNGGKGNKLSGI
jgi:hypothetical protein